MVQLVWCPKLGHQTIMAAWTVEEVEARVAPAEYAARQRMRSFGRARTTTLIGMRLSNSERAMIGAAYANLPGTIERSGEKRKFWRSGIKALMWNFGVRDDHLPARALRDLEAGKIHREFSKRGHKLDASQVAFDKVMMMQTKETSHRTLLSWFNEMEETETTNLSEFQRLMKRNKVVGKVRQAIPSLMHVHEIERMVFTSEQCSIMKADEAAGRKPIFLHIDEKNFKAFEFGKGKVYITEKMTKEHVRELSTLKCQSKRNISWVMFQGCCGEPRPELGFNGKLHIRRICIVHKAKKDSKYHKTGDRYDKHTNYNAEMHLMLMKELMAAITVQFKGIIPDDEVVFVQMDGAGPHSVPSVQAKIERMGRRNIPRVCFLLQIAQSCTLNFLDLALFNACGVRAARRDYRTVDELSAGVYKAWDSLPAEIISRVCALQKVVMVEMYNSRGSYISIPSVGIRNAQKAGKLDPFITEYLTTQMRKY